MGRAGESIERAVTAIKGNHSHGLRFEDVELFDSYSVIEIATLAAKCEGATGSDRVDAAIQLLSAAEWSAFIGKRERYRQRQIKGGRPDWASSDDLNAEIERREKSRRTCKQAKEICSEAERDVKTGKIVLSSLVVLAYQIAGKGSASPAHALRVFNEWMRMEATDIAKGISSKEIHRIAGDLPIDPSNYILWTDEQYRQWEELSEASLGAAVIELRGRSESKNRSPLIHDEDIAYELTRNFLGFLMERPEKESRDIVQSQSGETKGQILSPATRGAVWGDDGKYS